MSRRNARRSQLTPHRGVEAAAHFARTARATLRAHWRGGTASSAADRNRDHGSGLELRRARLGGEELAGTVDELAERFAGVVG
mgnify:CR=1 FL=1